MWSRSGRRHRSVSCKVSIGTIGRCGSLGMHGAGRLAYVLTLARRSLLIGGSRSPIGFDRGQLALAHAHMCASLGGSAKGLFVLHRLGAWLGDLRCLRQQFRCVLR